MWSPITNNHTIHRDTGKQRMELALAAEASAAKARVMRVERRGLRVDFYS